MKFLSFKSRQPTLREIEPPTAELIEADTPELPVLQQVWPANPFFSFTYYSQEMRITNGRTQVSFEKVRYEDGRIKSERIEGEMSADAYLQAVRDTQRLIADQTLAVMRQFTSLLSFPANNQKGKE